MTKPSLPIELYELKLRADEVWERPPSETGTISKILGSSEVDVHGQDYWLTMSLSSFMAPNFFIERENPFFLKSLNCVQLGEDRNNSPLYYFLSNGTYAVSTNEGLLLVANSTHTFFEAFILYAEWVEGVLKKHGSPSLINYQFTEYDLTVLEGHLTVLFKQNFEGSFWENEIMRLRKNMENVETKGSESV